MNDWPLAAELGERKRKLWYPSGQGTAASGDSAPGAATIDQTFERQDVNTTQALTNSQLRFTGNLFVPAGVTVTNLWVYFAANATTPTHTFGVLIDQALNVLGKTADLLTTALTGAAWKALPLTTPWLAPADTAVYLGLSSTAATPVSVSVPPGTLNALHGQNPKLGFNVAGTVDEPTDVGATITINATASPFWAAIS